MSLLSFSSYAEEQVEANTSDAEQSDGKESDEIVWSFTAGSSNKEVTYSIPRQELQSHTIEVLGLSLIHI